MGTGEVNLNLGGGVEGPRSVREIFGSAEEGHLVGLVIGAVELFSGEQKSGGLGDIAARTGTGL